MKLHFTTCHMIFKCYSHASLEVWFVITLRATVFCTLKWTECRIWNSPQSMEFDSHSWHNFLNIYQVVEFQLSLKFVDFNVNYYFSAIVTGFVVTFTKLYKPDLAGLG